MTFDFYPMCVLQKTKEYEKQVEELRTKLNWAEFKSSEASEKAKNLQEKETSIRGRLEKVQGELDTLKIESRKKQSTLQEERDDLKAQVATYTSRCQVRVTLIYLYFILTLTVLVTIIDAQWEGMGDVGSARYEPALLPPCPTIRVLSYSN